MREEDFVLGYVTGYNEGLSKGGNGRDGIFGDLTLLKKYKFLGVETNVELGVFKTEEMRMGWAVEPIGDPRPNYENALWSPTAYYRNTNYGTVVLVDGKIVGMMMQLCTRSLCSWSISGERPYTQDMWYIFSYDENILDYIQLEYVTGVWGTSSYNKDQRIDNLRLKMCTHREIHYPQTGEITVENYKNEQSSHIWQKQYKMTDGKIYCNSFWASDIYSSTNIRGFYGEEGKLAFQAWLACTGIEEVPA